MGKSYRRNDEYGNKYRGARKSNKKIDKNRKVRSSYEVNDENDNMRMRAGQYEN
jgi:hypothetical protein